MVVFVMIIFLVPALDSVIKYMVRSNLSEDVNIDTFLPFLKITYIKNFGAALGMFRGGKFIFIIITVIIILILLYLMIAQKNRNSMFSYACSFIIAGGIGNLIDRLYLGFVIDYLKISFFPPVCNISDYFISMGAALFVLYAIRNEKFFKSDVT